MPIDATASAALDRPNIKPVYLAFIDFLTEKMWVNTSGADVTLTGTGEPDIDGHTFLGLSANVVDIGPIKNASDGTDSVQIKLSGLPVLDADVISEIQDVANWQGREIRLWRIIRTGDNIQQGGVQHYYTGNMTRLSMPTSPQSQTIEVTVEGYLAAYAAASNRTYMDQQNFDAGDESAKATQAIANNPNGGPASIATGSIAPNQFSGGFGGFSI
ncbi:MAG: hypothetical protein U5N55_11750 [Cypionkella sp.]|nr:hypothetical protein [Cypionkella sp.]